MSFDWINYHNVAKTMVIEYTDPDSLDETGKNL